MTIKTIKWMWAWRYLLGHTHFLKNLFTITGPGSIDHLKKKEEQFL